MRNAPSLRVSTHVSACQRASVCVLRMPSLRPSAVQCIHCMPAAVPWVKRPTQPVSPVDPGCHSHGGRSTCAAASSIRGWNVPHGAKTAQLQPPRRPECEQDTVLLTVLEAQTQPFAGRLRFRYARCHRTRKWCEREWASDERLRR